MYSFVYARRALVLLIFSAASVAAGWAQTSARAEVDSLKAEVASLRRTLDSLKGSAAAQTVVADSSSAISTGSDEAMDALEERIEAKLTALESKIDALSRGIAPVVFNPRTVAFINFAARHDNMQVLDASGTHEVQNRAFLRSAELEMRAPVDPYAEGVIIATLENEAGKEFAVDAEEAYGLIKRVPILEEAPLGLKMKLGKFRPALGMNNKIHMHDLPWTTRPLAVSKFLGTEHGDFFEAGYAGTGVDLDFFVPSPIPDVTTEVNFDVLRAGDLGASVPTNDRQPAYIGHLSLSKDWENVSLLNIGLSSYQEAGPFPTAVYGADVTFKWSPVEERESHSLVAGAEGFIVDTRSTLDSSVTVRPAGWFTYLQYQPSYWLYLGARYDWAQELSNDRLTTRAMSVYASYYTTEFFRFRFGFEHRESDLPWENQRNTVLFDANFVFGSHPTEPYWVNR